ncbi:MAG: GAF domain-containing SpoIIE family protein phosphatase, partial [Planctomycetota bacterium]
LEALVLLLDKIGKSLEVDEVLKQLLDGLLTVFPDADHGVAALLDEETGAVTPLAVRSKSPSATAEEIRLSQTIVDRVLESGEAVLSANAMQDDRFRASRSLMSMNVRSLMCVPLMGRSGNRMGVIQLDASGEVGRFSRQDLAVLASILPHAVSSMEYAKIHAEELRQQAIQGDLEFARQIQRNFLPSRQPQIEGYDFFSFYEAAYRVGGDYYDYVALSDDRMGVVVADVAGKGVSAALLMSKFAGEFKYLLSREEALDRAVKRMNDVLTADETMTRFITMAIAVLDPRSHQVTLVNAGHTDPLLRAADGGVTEIGEEEKGAPLGLFPEQHYQTTRFALGRGDVLLLYTDGINEATRADDALYGVDRLKRVASEGAADAADLGGKIISDVHRFVGGRPQSDDLCVLCIQRS